MPKSFPEHERAAIDRALRRAADTSLRRSGVRGTTVDELVAAAGISKGAFYTFYRSREALLWQVVKEEERRLIDAIGAIASRPEPIEDRLRTAFQEHLLAVSGLGSLLTEENLALLTRKLPPEVLASDSDAGEQALAELLRAFSLDDSAESISLLHAMVQTLRFVASGTASGDGRVTDRILASLTDAFVAELLIHSREAE